MARGKEGWEDNVGEGGVVEAERIGKLLGTGKELAGVGGEGQERCSREG